MARDQVCVSNSETEASFHLGILVSKSAVLSRQIFSSVAEITL